MGIIIEEKLNELRELSEGTDQLLCDLLDKFITNSKKYLDQIKQGVQENDYEKVQFSVHTMKGSSLSLGLRDLGKLLTELNAQAKTNNLEGFGTAIPQIESLILEVEEYRKTLS